jgi:quercetin dioxygenase-like cupin family protein
LSQLRTKRYEWRLSGCGARVSSHEARASRYCGWEYGYLLRGELVLTLGFDDHLLRPGDAVSFDSTTPHPYRNDGTDPAVGVWFVVENEP